MRIADIEALTFTREMSHGGIFRSKTMLPLLRPGIVALLSLRWTIPSDRSRREHRRERVLSSGRQAVWRRLVNIGSRRISRHERRVAGCIPFLKMHNDQTMIARQSVTCQEQNLLARIAIKGNTREGSGCWAGRRYRRIEQVMSTSAIEVNNSLEPSGAAGHPLFATDGGGQCTGADPFWTRAGPMTGSRPEAAARDIAQGNSSRVMMCRLH